MTWKISLIGAQEAQRRTIHALGLRKVGQSVVREDTPTIRGMLNRVSHLVQVEELHTSERTRAAPATGRKE